MRRSLKGVCALAAVLVFATAASAGMMSTLSGEVTKYDAGKAIAVKDDLGKVHTVDITADTKVEGDVKVGGRVTVQTDGKMAKSVKVPSGG